MGNHHDSIALDWVRGEIQDTLTQGQHALEAYVENRDDTARLRFCLNYLHQVHGTLQMVELYGAALLTEEMEKLTQALLNDTVTSVDEAVDVLMQAILQLPQYLEHLTSSRDDFPLILLPLLNDLRAARGEALLSDTSLFKPDLSRAHIRVSPKAAQRLQDPNVLGHVRKLRQMYQFALAGVVREDDLPSHFDYLQKVIARLIRLCQKTPRGELWRAAGAFVETLQAQVNPVNAAVKSLLRELDTEIRRLSDEHARALQSPAPEALLKHLLYYVARARDLDTPQVNAVRTDYQLAEALPSEDDVDAARTRASGPGREAIHSVVGALNEELAKLKDQLDLFVRSDLRQNAELEDLLPGLHLVSNTLAVLGLGIPRRVVNEQAELVQRLIGQAEPADDGTLMDIAGALLYVEASLAGLDNDLSIGSAEDDGTSAALNLGSRELDDASSALLRESRNTLEQVKSAIVNFIASQWDTREIDHVPGLLHSIRGGLALIPLDQVSDMLGCAERYVTDVLLGSRQVPDWKQLDTLADAVTSIEYYLERLAEGIGENDGVLRVAEDSLTSLGFPPGAEPTWQAPDTSVAPPVLSDSAEPDVAPEPEAVKGSDDTLLDDEILEIFVEEAGEVLETIHEFYPRLRQDHSDREALSEVRRAFHTLKGSGRLVGATSIGELAWSVENLLNRVIDQTVRPTDELFGLIDDVNDRIPGLIQEFRTGDVHGDVAGLIARAEALADTRRADDTAALRADGDAADAGDGAEVTMGATEDNQEEVPPATEAPAVASDADDDLIDDDILEIFIEEAGEVLDTVREYLPMLLRQHDDRSALTEIRRAFHTLKGSGRMVGALVVGELAWAVENMLNRVIDGSVFMNDDIARLLQDVTDALPALVSDFEHRRPASQETGGFEARARALANGEIPDASVMPTAETPLPGDHEAATIEVAEEDELDPVLLDIFQSEAETHLQTLRDYVAAAGDKTSTAYTDDLSRALHTLKGSANTAGIEPIARVITPLEHFVKESRAQNRRADQPVIELIRQVCEFLDQGLAQIQNAPQQTLAGTDDFLAQLEALASGGRDGASAERDEPAEQSRAQLVELFLNEGLDIVLDAERILDEWAAAPEDTGPVTRLRDELGHLTLGAADAGLADVSELAGALRDAYAANSASDQSPTDGFFEVVREAHEQLINMMDQVAAGLATHADPTLVDELRRFAVAAAPREDDPFDQAFTDDLDVIDRSLDDDSAEATSDSAAPDDDSLPPLPETDESDDSDMDDELAAIFLEEARDLVNSTADALQQWSEDTGNTDLLRLLQRDLHTLKGGARLADIGAVGDLSHELETLFEGLTDQRLAINPSLSDLLFRSHDRLASMVEAMEAGQAPRPAPDLISDIRAYMAEARGERPTTNVGDAGTAADTERDTPAANGGESLADLDPELVGIFLEEAYDLVNSTSSALHTWSEDPTNTQVAAELQRDVHTLKGGARMAGVDAIGDLSHVLEDLFERVADGRLTASGTMMELLFACHDRLASMVDQVATHKPCPPATDLIHQVEGILRGDTGPAPTEESIDDDLDWDSDTVGPALNESLSPAPADDDLIGIFLDEGVEIHDALLECLSQWREQPDELAGVTRLQQELHTLKGGARLADVDAVAELAEAWSDALDPVLAGDVEPARMLPVSDRAVVALRAMLDSLESGQLPTVAPELVAEFTRPPESGADQVQTDAEAQDASVDPEVLEIFLEEAGELLDQLERLLADWQKEPANHDFNQEAQRALHTLKGGARLAQLKTLGDQAHELETRLIDLGGNAPEAADWQAITGEYDRIGALVAEVRARAQGGDAPAPEAPAAEPAPVEPVDTAPSSPPAAPEAPAPKPAAKPAQPRRQGRDNQRAQETIRVSAPLLDDLVNLAGETSITRGRLETQTSDFSHTLDEMAATIERLREQLRRMDIETEAQILFRAEQEHGPDYGDDFDPLEMDRYSSIQQLSRALTESSSDLADLRETLSDRVRDTETLLVQQSRINTELQEGLMKTRMIPFASMVPRLRRIVRQISGELGKKVEFDVRNAEGEMDRNILERMIAPLEHMLRNALDHGIETPEDRLKAGKPDTGEVVLSLTREGGDVVLRMMDDGKGIPTKVIRDKAIRQGMLGADEDLSDREILQFILQPGFSTAEKVTQISGRGVGMDVVASEIKQLGGSLDIDSALGRGTTFTVRLPFTVSVNRALMVTTGEDFYAIPLNTIEGIVRVSTYELEEYYKPDAPLFEYAGQHYRLQYLGGLLNSDHQPKLQGQALPLPVILVRGAEQPMALQVDSLMGSREIVVKSLGPQFSSVRGVSGATILGDGNVVVILDLPAMIRSDILSERQRLASLEKARDAARYEQQVTTVMVVDDSVTVRKVTSRLLERNGMEVITAKDGLDAVAQLQDHHPDIILLDIEMPRMDGFEVASFVRHDEQLKHTPICMITSRTGEKHRERALAIGVNEYLGKPFQEAELLATIQRLTGHE
ncbi:hybrid sensor histidine kinase/response regulator [Marinobacter sp. C2H3]|uniref:hybrid sensor histidine kinase/response regulator n=1 Tax=Marinobacter sp. C2H3 TaxID=3119003 RepID=UPI00300E8E69